MGDKEIFNFMSALRQWNIDCSNYKNNNNIYIYQTTDWSKDGLLTSLNLIVTTMFLRGQKKLQSQKVKGIAAVMFLEGHDLLSMQLFTIIGRYSPDLSLILRWRLKILMTVVIPAPYKTMAFRLDTLNSFGGNFFSSM